MPAKKKVTIVTDELREWVQPIAIIVAPQGLKGEVRVKPIHSAAEQLFSAGSEMCLVLPSGRRQKLTIQRCYNKGSVWIVKFSEIGDIDTAEKLVGLKLAVHKDWKPQLKEGEFLLSELLGMKVVTEEGKIVGEVLDILESPTHDLIVTEQAMIPMSRKFIKEVDTKGRKIVVSLPEGLLSKEVPKKRRPRWQR